MHGARQRKPGAVSLMRAQFHLRAARIGQAQQFRHLVEGLADRVVNRRPDAQVIVDAAHGDQLRVPARDQQKQVGKLDIVGHPRGQRVRLQMIDRHEWLPGDQRQSLARRQPDHDAADQPRPRRGGDSV